MENKYFKINFKLGYPGANGDAEREAFVVAKDWNEAAEKVIRVFLLTKEEHDSEQIVQVEKIELINSAPTIYYGAVNKSKQTILI